jgi:DNA-binding SARP family transcriptional activator
VSQTVSLNSTGQGRIGLGSMGLEHSGKPVAYRGRKRLELLAYLLEARLAGRAEAGILDLLDAIFPEHPEAEARHTLKQHIYLIRGSLGPSSVLSTHGGYALGAVSSDAEEFLASGNPALWSGPYLDGLCGGWLPGVRDTLTQALRVKVEDLLGSDAPDDTSEAARLARILCDMDPYDTATLHLAVQALEATGAARAASRLYSERRTAFLEVGKVLPRTPAVFMASALG